MIVYDIRNLTHIYPGQTRPANKNITLQIHAGEVFGLLGDNGAGKTTLVRQMMNLLRPSAGSVELYGRNVAVAPLHAPTNVGYMPQDAHALNNLTVGEALYYTAHLRGLSRADARTERDMLLELWQMADLRNSNSTRLSGGQRRLLRLAVAMAGLMPVLILDEPTNDLAPQRRRLVWEILGQINRDWGTTIIFITHDAIEAEKVVQRVGIMREGELVAVGSPSELKREVDQKLRLEMILSPDSSPRLPDGLVAQQLQPGRWMVLVDRKDANAVLDGLDLDQLDDFRLYSATLEDLYVHYAT